MFSIVPVAFVNLVFGAVVSCRCFESSSLFCVYLNSPQSHAIEFLPPPPHAILTPSPITQVSSPPTPTFVWHPPRSNSFSSTFHSSPFVCFCPSTDSHLRTRLRICRRTDCPSSWSKTSSWSFSEFEIWGRSIGRLSRGSGKRHRAKWNESEFECDILYHV